MSASTFDTLKAARELEAAGMNRTHAEAIAKTMRDAAGADLDRIATKAATSSRLGRASLNSRSVCARAICS